MKVLVTGATGLVGGHTAAALQREGHEVTALVRDVQRLERAMASLDAPVPGNVVGDMTIRGDVERAAQGTDAVVHCAAIVSLDHRRAEEIMEGNLAGLRNVLEVAAKGDLDPVIYTSSTSALFSTDAGVLTTEHPVSRSSDAYGASKAACETLARDYQERGAPVTITYPSGILGPPAGDAFGETAQGVSGFAAAGVIPTRRGALSWIDVRDLARIQAALVEPGRGPRRVMCGGHLVTMERLAEMLRSLTGRRFPIAPTSPSALRVIGDGLDALRSFLPIDTPLSREAMDLITCWAGTDDSDLEALGVRLRPAQETMRDSLMAWHGEGMMTDRQIGSLASRSVPTGTGVSISIAPAPKGIRVPAKVLASGPFRKLSPRVIPAFHRAVLKASGGRTLLATRANPMLMLTTTGARSGQERRTPLAAVPRTDGGFVVVGSNFAAEKHPAWTANLLAHPDATINVEGREAEVRARLLPEEQVQVLWPDLVAWFPNWVEYTNVTDRRFRVFALDPVS
ncbi:MAG: nitroreductase family deazaflavin-dependent oxidoreductase [Microthrixaceae bacterium]